MPYCTNCGAAVTENFCSNCGTPIEAVQKPVNDSEYNVAPKPIIHENAKVKARYGFGSLLIGGYFGLPALILFIASVIIFFAELLSIIPDGDLGISLSNVFACLILALIFYLPIIILIYLKSPKKTFAKTLLVFLVKCLFFCIAWAISIVGCLFIIGLFFGIWRLGLLASSPNDSEYTAFVDGEKIAVIRLIDEQYSSGDKTRYIYVDKNGEFYRPPVK